MSDQARAAALPDSETIPGTVCLIWLVLPSEITSIELIRCPGTCEHILNATSLRENDEASSLKVRDQLQPKTLGSVADVLAFVSRLREAWASAAKLPLKAEEELWFRGENSLYATPLHPQLYRYSDGKPAKESIRALLKQENTYCESFKKWGFQFCENPPDDDWEWYFLMQHHGVPTRLLDWSDGALIALHFAVYRNLDNDGNPRLYILDPTWLQTTLDTNENYGDAKRAWKKACKGDPEDRDEWDRIYLFDDEDEWKKTPLPAAPLALEFYNITRRIAAQRSRFIVLGKKRDWLQTVFLNPASRLKHVDIDRNKVPQIKRELADAGITESVIFPDLDGVGREINQQWQHRPLPKVRTRKGAAKTRRKIR